MPFKHAVRPAVILATLLFAVGLCGIEPPQAEAFVVSGTIVREDKSPVAGVKVQIVESKGSGYVLRFSDCDAEGPPNQETDSLGKFSIKVKRSFFKDNQEFSVLAGFSGQKASILKLGGGIAAVQIDKTTKAYKLGEITFTDSMILDEVTHDLMKEIRKTAAKKLDRKLTPKEVRAVETPRSHVALEMILDRVRGEPDPKELARYLAEL